MPLVLVKRLLGFSVSSFHQHHHVTLLTPLLLLRLSFSTQPSEQTQKETPFVAKYLVSSFGFSPDRALKVSSRSNLAAIKSSDRPDSVVRFFNDMGLSESQVKAVVSFHPDLLGSNAEKTLKPRVREWMDAGFSREMLVQVIRFNPSSLYLKDTLSRLLFWRDFAGNCDQALLKIIQRNSLLIQCDINKYVVPKLNLLNEYELSKQDILPLFQSGSRFMTHNLDSLRQTLELIEELGVPRGSRSFLYAVRAVGAYSKDKIQTNLKFFTNTYGWSQEEVYAAFRNYPHVLAFSEEKVKSTMDFLIRKAGFESKRIASHPWLLKCSVERKLMPRFTVWSALDAKGLQSKKKCSFSTACKMSERCFYERFVVPFEKDVPGLTEAYVAAGGVKMHG